MTDNPLLKKLRLRPGNRAAIVNAPHGYVESLHLPEDITVTDLPDGQSNVVQIFVSNSSELSHYVRTVLSKLKPDCVLWFCYPKLSSGIHSDLTRDAGWQALYEAGWRGVASIAIDDTWSGLRFRPEEHEKEEDALEAQYRGAKAALRPIYDRVLAIVQGFGDDIEVQTRKTYVAFARGKQFAVVQPATRTRVDIGLKLPGVPTGGRLESATNTGSGSITHKVELASLEAIDEELVGWLRRAYEDAGK